MLYEIGYYGALGIAAAALGIAAWQAWRARKANKRREDEVYKLQHGTLSGLRREQALEDRIDELEREIRRRDSRIHHMAETRAADMNAAWKEGREQGLREQNLEKIEMAWNAAQNKRKKVANA